MIIGAGKLCENLIYLFYEYMLCFTNICLCILGFRSCQCSIKENGSIIMGIHSSPFINLFIVSSVTAKYWPIKQRMTIPVFHRYFLANNFGGNKWLWSLGATINSSWICPSFSELVYIPTLGCSKSFVQLCTEWSVFFY